MLFRQANEQDEEKRKEEKQIVKEIQKKELCPTCYNMRYGGVYEDISKRRIYTDDVVDCFLEQYPRNEGHTIILVKKHYEDITQLPEDVGAHVIKIIIKLTQVLKETLNAEKIYVCTMCDGGRNHLHFQLIPRLKNDMLIGSKVFVKPRGVVVIDKEKINELRNKMKSCI